MQYRKPQNNGNNGSCNRTDHTKATTNQATTRKMFDLKMYLLDFMRFTSNSTSQKKSLKEISDRYPTKQMQNEVNVIYFNENMSMTSKFNRNNKFQLNAKNGNLGLLNQNRSMRDWIGSNVTPTLANLGIRSNENKTNGTCFECSIERNATTITKSSSTTNSPLSESSPHETETDDCLGSYSDCTATNVGEGGNLDSFCTLCTSSFSFNRCNRCEESSCSSKCNSEPKNENAVPFNNDAIGSGSSGAGTSECDSVLFR